MDKRVVFAAAFSVLILVAWSYLFPPPKRVPREGPAPVTSEQPAPDADEIPGPPPPSAAPALDEVRPAEATPVQATGVEEIRFENELFQIAMTNEGGRVVSWKLLPYTTSVGDPLELLPQFVDGRPLFLGVELDDPALTDTLNEALYRVERRPFSASRGLPAGETVVFSWADGTGLQVRKSLTFHNGSYALCDECWLVDVELEVSDRGRRLPARLTVGPGFTAQGPGDKGRTNYHYEGVVINSAGRVAHKKKGRLSDGGAAGEIRWAGLEDQYFAALILPAEPQPQAQWQVAELTRQATDVEEAPEPSPQPLLSIHVPEGGARIYVGPKKFTLLRSLGYELDGVVWFASNGFLAWIAKFIFLALIWIHDHTIPNYGVAIVLATFLLRLLLFPVNQYSMVSMKKAQLQMQRLQPKIKAIKSKYKGKKAKDADSRAKMNQETMDLYRREGVNPMGGVTGCLPLLAQFPILIGFYNMLTVAVELRGAPFFGWIQDLSLSDPFYVTPLLMGVTMFVQQKMAMSKVKDPMQQQQQKFMMIMPVVFTYICIQMPSGMVLYWFVNNLLGIGQQWLVNRHTTRLEAAALKA